MGIVGGVALAALALGGRLGGGRLEGASAERSLRADPLAADPFVAAARARPERAVALLVEARARVPHALGVRAELMRARFAMGDVPGGIAELAGIARIAPAAGATIGAEVGKRAPDAAAAAEAARAFAPYPALAEAFFDGLGQRPGAPVAAAAVEASPPLTFRDPGVRRAAVSALLAANDFPRAWALWGAGAAAVPLRDPGLRRLNSGDPFDWQATPGPAGAVDPAPGGGVELTVYGRAPAVLAARRLVLPPGRYRLGYSARTAGLAPGRLRLRVICAESGVAIADAPLASRDAPSGARLGFAVPATGCGGQTLDLFAAGGDGTGGTATLRRVTVERG